GCFICKFFDTFTHVSCSLLYVAAALFQQVDVVKPRHSRVVNSERYLVAQGFKVWRHREIFIVSSMPCSEHLQLASDGARARPHHALRRSGPQCSAHKNIGPPAPGKARHLSGWCSRLI
ncbi:unnamed protein product, partial [Symbiodinium necroappetens]